MKTMTAATWRNASAPHRRIISAVGQKKRVLKALRPICASVELLDTNVVNTKTRDYIVLCPICLKTEFRLDDRETLLKCERCQRSFDTRSKFVDLTLSSGLKDTAYALTDALGVSTFQNPLVGFVYERGWRQTFARSGFPGPDKEFEAVMQYLEPVKGGTVVDLSCGSGLFTRRFLSSGEFDAVVAVDFSEAMLTQTQQFVDRMQPKPTTSLQLIRADVARLPFPAGSFNAVFAGAAIHCWPEPALALAEISRILAPGGIFVFSTFTQRPKEIDDLLDQPILRSFRPLFTRRSTATVIFIEKSFIMWLVQINFWDVNRLRDLCRMTGLENFVTIRNRNYIMVCVNKPNVNTSV